MMGSWLPTGPSEPPVANGEPGDPSELCKQWSWGSKKHPVFAKFEEALRMLEWAVDASTDVDGLQALHGRLVDGIVRKIEKRVEILEEFSISVVTMSGVRHTIPHLRPDEHLLSLARRVHKELSVPKGFEVHFCHGQRAFSSADHRKTLRSLGVCEDMELSCVLGKATALEPGEYARICGLRNHVELNDLVVQIVASLDEGRFEVVSPSTRQHFRVRRTNLEPASASALEEEESEAPAAGGARARGPPARPAALAAVAVAQPQAQAQEREHDGAAAANAEPIAHPQAMHQSCVHPSTSSSSASAATTPAEQGQEEDAAFPAEGSVARSEESSREICKPRGSGDHGDTQSCTI